MLLSDFTALENIEFEACTDLYRAAPEEVRVAHDIVVFDIGMTTCLTCRGIEPALVFRRAVRLGVGRTARQTELDEVISYMDRQGLSYAVPVASRAQPSALISWLEGRGFTRGYAWMKFRRLCEDAPQTTCSLDIRVIGSEFGGEFGRIVAEGFGLPPTVAPWIAKLAGRANWACVMAFAGGIRGNVPTAKLCVSSTLIQDQADNPVR